VLQVLCVSDLLPWWNKKFGRWFLGGKGKGRVFEKQALTLGVLFF